MRFTTLVLCLAACGGADPAIPDASPPDGALSPDAEMWRCPTPTLVPVATASEVVVIGDTGSTRGIFDPSLVYPAGAPGGAMAYTSVPDQHSLQTRIALSGDAGASWTYVGDANAPELATLTSSDLAECPGGACTGFLISEVPSLVFDAADPVESRRWKLFAHRYLAEANDRLHYRLGTITMQTAKDPQGPWSAPRKLFGLDSPSPFTTTDVAYNASELAATADCLVLTEPAALASADRLDLAMGCVYLAGTTPKIRIVLARTTDHGATWSMVARVLDAGDGDCLDVRTPGASVNAAELFVGADGRTYLAASADDGGYRGCLVYPFADVIAGKIERDTEGRARPHRALATDTGQFSGACAWGAGAGGYLLDVGFLDSPRPFRIFRAGVVAP